MSNFTHLHLHTQYSILDGASAIPKLLDKAKSLDMKAVAITDHGNMFGVKLFHKTAQKVGIKPILGCEVYVAEESRFRRDKIKDKKSNHLVVLAKNQVGYHNLIKLVSYGWTEGFYRKPRIDKELLEKYKEGLIVSSACLGGSVPQAIMKGDIEAAEADAAWYKSIFGDDYYLELQRHETGDPQRDAKIYNYQKQVNEAILKIAQKLDIKYIATNDVHFINREDSASHDILITLSTGAKFDDPNRMRYTGEEYFKTADEMSAIFSDLPEAIANTMEIADKVEEYDLNRKPVMPEFKLPEGFESEADYLRHITYEGGKMRWGEISKEQKERLDFELDTIIGMGFPGYFLIVWDFLKAARDMGVSVGPGRGSAAGSAVAYCLKITDIDPIKYDLLFERFLNPDRISMPDIDIDFDEDGREKVLKWVVKKYGDKRVANIITFGTMATKSSIKDVARTIELPLNEANRLAKLVPEKPGTTFEKAYKESPELKAEKQSKDPLIVSTLKFAENLEGSVRQTGVHACGIIIGKDDLENYVPLSTSKESDLYVTQYDGKHVEDIGLLKMDFLGLKTLSIIMDAVKNVKLSKGIDIDIDKIPINDELTYQLYAKGETTGIFQFESEGMKKYLKQLKPTRFDDLIAMNALYRPGPMDYIPSFINRKHGREKIVYDLPEMEELLESTYGITVYQEQVMRLSQKLAGFTKGQADSLRKAMGKKIIAMMNELKGLFVKGCAENGHPEKVVEKIWADWESFAQYAFNKSHSTCYAYVSYQTAYLKAHHPAEYMAAVLSRNLSNIKKVTIFMEEAKRMGLDILGPSVNESFHSFTVNKKGQVRFGIGAIKGVGEAAVADIIKEREENGAYKDFYDFVERVNLSSVNKRTVEALVYAGGFDEISGLSRSQFFAYSGNSDLNFLEECLKYGNKLNNGDDTSQASLFGGDEAVEIKKPDIPQVEEWDRMERLDKEREVIGIYLSEHPLDSYKLEIQSYCNTQISELADIEKLKGKDLKIAGIVKNVTHAMTKNGKPYGAFEIEDYGGSYRVMLFSNDYIKFKNYLTKNYALLLTGKVDHRFGNPKMDLEFKLKSVEMLSEMKDKMLKTLAIKIPITKISDSVITELNSVMNSFKGNKNLQFLIYDPETKVHVTMFSRTHKVNITEELLALLDKNSNIVYKVS